MALKDDGTVWAWGYNYVGQLGDGSTTNRTVPVRVSYLSAMVAIDASGDHSIALKSDGTVWVWGLKRVLDFMKFEIQNPPQRINPELQDIIRTLQIIAGISLTDDFFHNYDINNDGRIGLAEAIHMLQAVAGTR